MSVECQKRATPVLRTKSPCFKVFASVPGQHNGIHTDLGIGGWPSPDIPCLCHMIHLLSILICVYMFVYTYISIAFFVFNKPTGSLTCWGRRSHLPPAHVVGKRRPPRQSWDKWIQVDFNRWNPNELHIITIYLWKKRNEPFQNIMTMYFLTSFKKNILHIITYHNYIRYDTMIWSPGGARLVEDKSKALCKSPWLKVPSWPLTGRSLDDFPWFFLWVNWWLNGYGLKLLVFFCFVWPRCFKLTFCVWFVCFSKSWLCKWFVGIKLLDGILWEIV